MYTKDTMETYLFFGFVIADLVVSSRTQDVGNDINSGMLSNQLLLPISFFGRLIAREVADKFMNGFLSVIEIVALLLIIQPTIVVPSNVSAVVITIGVILLSFVLHFTISLLISMAGFWTNEVWGLRFIFFIFLESLTGALVPLDLFPAQIAKVLFYTPFAYMFYFPLKVYLQQVSTAQIIEGVAVMSVWAIILSGICMVVWRVGLTKYQGEGR